MRGKEKQNIDVEGPSSQQDKVEAEELLQEKEEVEGDGV